MDQGVKHYCGIFGVYGCSDAARLTRLGPNALQHRGEERFGIAVGDGQTIHVHKGMGQVSEVFNRPEIFDQLKGHLAIGHNRYSTTGLDTPNNVQPFVAECGGHIADEKSVEQIRGHLGVDSLGYLSQEGMIQCAPNGENQNCTACFDRSYPIPVESKMHKRMLENR